MALGAKMIKAMIIEPVLAKHIGRSWVRDNKVDNTWLVEPSGFPRDPVRVHQGVKVAYVPLKCLMLVQKEQGEDFIP